MLPQSFYENISDFIFMEDVPKKADIILIPGGSYPSLPEKAAQLWRDGYAPWVLPSGRFSIKTGVFNGVKEHPERYCLPYETEWDFMRDVLIQNGVNAAAILREDQSQWTKQNAQFSRRVTDEAGIQVNRALLCCKAFHARRAYMCYQLAYPQAEILVQPVVTGELRRENWFQSPYGIQRVLGELERCGSQFVQELSGSTQH